MLPFFNSLPGRAALYQSGKNIFYRLVSAIIPQNQLVLLTSSPEDKFGNITALAKKLKEMAIPFYQLDRKQFQKHPLRALVTLARAHVFVIDAASPVSRLKLHRNTRLLQCWHACGAYKKIAFDAKRKNYNDANEEIRIQRIHGRTSWFVCTSQETARTYSKAFRLPLDRMLVFGSPRLDAYIQDSLCPAPAVYTLLYAPTYRTRDDSTRYIPPPPDAEALRAGLTARLGETVRLAFRGHPTAPVLPAFDDWEDWSNLSQQEALRRASVLITDYSSIFFDFLPYRRPIVFYVPDFDEYQRQERELYFSPYDAFPETTCSDERTLLNVLTQCRHMKTGYEAIWQKHMSACDGKSSERLCTFIKKIMKRDMQ